MTIEILGVDKTGLLMAGTLRIVRRADHRNDCSFSLLTTAAGYLPAVGQDVKITDGTKTLFGGVIKNIIKRRPGVGVGENTLIEVEIASDGYYGIPARRTPGQWSYNNKTCGYIVDDVVTRLLADEGVTAGTIEDGATLIEYDSSGFQAKDILDDMAAASGYKWYIDDEKALHFVDEDTIVDAEHDITEDGEFTDFGDVIVEETLDNYRNKQFVVGGIGDDGHTIMVIDEDTDEIADQQDREGGSTYSTGVYGNVIEDGNIETVEDAEIVAADALKLYGVIPQTVSFVSRTLDWDAGTRLKVNLPTFGISEEKYYLIEECIIEDEDGKNLKCTIHASARRADSFSTKRTQKGIDYFTSLVKAAKAGGTGATTTYGGHRIFVQPDEPATAKVGDIWIDTGDDTLENLIDDYVNGNL
jgi:hypothetical protein